MKNNNNEKQQQYINELFNEISMKFTLLRGNASKLEKVNLTDFQKTQLETCKEIIAQKFPAMYFCKHQYLVNIRQLIVDKVEFTPEIIKMCEKNIVTASEYIIENIITEYHFKQLAKYEAEFYKLYNTAKIQNYSLVEKLEKWNTIIRIHCVYVNRLVVRLKNKTTVLLLDDNLAQNILSNIVCKGTIDKEGKIAIEDVREVEFDGHSVEFN
jgi:hypothetical protein